MASAGSDRVELFGSLQLQLGGKNGYAGVRGGQGKQKDKFQAYVNISGMKRCIPGLHDSPHEAAVALALWKLNQQLGFEDAAAEPKPRAKRGSKRVQQQENPCRDKRESCYQMPAMSCPMAVLSPAQLNRVHISTPVTTAVMQLPSCVPASMFGLPVAHARLMESRVHTHM